MTDSTVERPGDWAPGQLLSYEMELASKELDVPGRVVEDVLIPARGFLRARTIKTGQRFRIIDVEGRQVPDVILYDPANLKNLSSMTNTQLVARRWKLTTGDAIYAKFGQRMATITDDTVGTHVFAGGFCNAEVNEVRYGIEGTHACRMNMVASMAQYGLAPADIEEGLFAPFMNMTYQPDGRLEIAPPPSEAGDYLELQADMDIILALSNCPSEHNPCNDWNPTPLRVVIYDPE